jgi:hypothetical protein
MPGGALARYAPRCPRGSPWPFESRGPEDSSPARTCSPPVAGDSGAAPSRVPGGSRYLDVDESRDPRQGDIDEYEYGDGYRDVDESRDVDVDEVDIAYVRFKPWRGEPSPMST